MSVVAAVLALAVTGIGGMLLAAQECSGCAERRPSVAGPAAAGSCTDGPGPAPSQDAHASQQIPDIKADDCSPADSHLQWPGRHFCE